VALFWTGREPHTAAVPIESLLGHTPACEAWTARDLWAGVAPSGSAPSGSAPSEPRARAAPSEPRAGPLVAEIPAHGVVWLAVTPSPRPTDRPTPSHGPNRLLEHP
jgi:hypothetical protein